MIKTVVMEMNAQTTTILAARVASITADGERVRVFELEALDGRALPPYDAGAHIDVHVAGLVRQYSLCGSGGQPGYQIAVLQTPDSRGGSMAMHALSVGEVLQISTPRNLFPLQPAEHTILVAGGIGVTPILAMAESLWRDRQSFELHYCARSREAAAFLDRLSAAPWAASVRTHFDDGPAGQGFDARAVLATNAPNRHLYVCGPAGMIEAVLATARDLAWPSHALHWEAFAPPSPPALEGGAFEVEIKSSGQVIVVGDEETIVEALERQGVAIEVSCGQGICGACLTRVLSGAPDHRDFILTDEERSQFMTPCCSRALGGRLVLDL